MDSDRSSDRTFTGYAYVVFIFAGVMTTMLGPILPLLMEKWRLDPAVAGRLFMAQFGAATLGTIVAARLVRTKTSRLLVAIALLFCCTGVSVLLFLAWPFLAAGVALYGIGLGICIPVLNLAVAETQCGTDFTRVSLLNACWTAGAIMGPLLLDAVRMRAFFVVLSVTAASLAVASFSVPGIGPYVRIAETPRLRLTLTFAVLFFIYVGCENAISGWLTVYGLPLFGDAYRAMLPVSVFWSALLIGRILARAIRQPTFVRLVLPVCSTGAILGFIILFWASHFLSLTAGALISALALAPVYPLLISRMASLLGQRTAAATLCFAFSGFGGAIVPYLSGLLSQRFGQARAGLALPVMLMILLLSLYSAPGPHRAQAVS